KQVELGEGCDHLLYRLCGLTLDMSGGRRTAKPAVGRPLDGRVRAHLAAQYVRARQHSQREPSWRDLPTSTQRPSWELRPSAATAQTASARDADAIGYGAQT